MSNLRKVNILVSHDGNCYFVDHHTQTIKWSHEVDRSIYEGFHDDQAEEYIDAQNDEFGNVEIFRHKHSSRRILTVSDDKMHDYLESRFGEEVTHRKCEHIVNVNLNSGRFTNRTSNVVQIKEVRHFMNTCHWRLEVARFKASLIGEDESESQHIHVYHTLTLENFINVCENINTYKFSSGLTMGDFVFPFQLKMANNIEIKGKESLVKVEIADGNEKLVVGRFNRCPAAILLVDNSIGIYEKHKNIMMSTFENHNNIVRFYGSELGDDGQYLLAFELCSIQLPMFLNFQKTDELDAGWLNFWRGLIRGVRHLHGKGLSHGSINPWKVLLTNDYMVKLYGLDNCQILNDGSRDSDLVDLGKLVAFCFSHPRPTLSKERFYKSERSPNLGRIPSWTKEAKEVARMLLNRQQHQSLTLDDVLVHPWLWSCDKRFHFFKEVSELLHNAIVDTSKIDGIKSRCWDTSLYWDNREKRRKEKGWDIRLDKKLFDYMRLRHGYNVTSVCDLIRFIRNVHSHHVDIGTELKDMYGKKFVGETTAHLEKMFRLAFPNLLLCLYQEVKNDQVAKPMLESFFKLDV